MLNDADKAFMMEKVLAEMSVSLTLRNKVAVVIMALERQVQLWREFLRRSGSMVVADNWQEVKGGGEVFLSTLEAIPDELEEDLAEKVELCIIDNGQEFVNDEKMIRVINKLR